MSQLETSNPWNYFMWHRWNYLNKSRLGWKQYKSGRYSGSDSSLGHLHVSFTHYLISRSHWIWYLVGHGLFCIVEEWFSLPLFVWHQTVDGRDICWQWWFAFFRLRLVRSHFRFQVFGGVNWTNNWWDFIVTWWPKWNLKSSNQSYNTKLWVNYTKIDEKS